MKNTKTKAASKNGIIAVDLSSMSKAKRDKMERLAAAEGVTVSEWISQTLQAIVWKGYPSEIVFLPRG